RTTLRASAPAARERFCSKPPGRSRAGSSSAGAPRSADRLAPDPYFPPAVPDCPAVTAKDSIMPAPTALTDTDIRVRTATPEDGDTLVELISLVDLQLRAEEVPGALAPMRHALADSDDGPLSHRRNHFLIAENSEGVPVGAIACGFAKWMSDPNRSPKIMRRRIVERISTVHGLAVVPAYRNRGIARTLLQHAEETLDRKSTRLN